VHLPLLSLFRLQGPAYGLWVPADSLTLHVCSRSVQGYGPKHPSVDSFVYPGSGGTSDSRLPAPPVSAAAVADAAEAAAEPPPAPAAPASAGTYFPPTPPVRINVFSDLCSQYCIVLLALTLGQAANLSCTLSGHAARGCMQPSPQCTKFSMLKGASLTHPAAGPATAKEDPDGELFYKIELLLRLPWN